MYTYTAHTSEYSCLAIVILLCLESAELWPAHLLCVCVSSCVYLLIIITPPTSALRIYYCALTQGLAL